MSDTDLTPEGAQSTVEEAAGVMTAPEPEAQVADATVDAPEIEAEVGESVVEEAPVEEAVPEEPATEEVAEEKAAEAAPEPAAEASEDVEGEDALFEKDEPVRVQSPFDRPGRWYVVHTQSGHEKKAQQNLAARTESMNMEERIYESVIPMEDVAEFRNGKKVIVQKKMFPGYLLVRANLDDDAWYVIRNTPSVVNFVGSGGKPSPLLRREVETFLQVKEDGVQAESAPRTKARLEYDMGETVRVKEGPFADFSGEIVEINEDQLKVKVLVNIFGRETPVELEFSQIARL